MNPCECGHTKDIHFFGDNVDLSTPCMANGCACKGFKPYHTIYRGAKYSPTAGPGAVTKQKPNLAPMIFNPAPSQKVWNHSPDGFSWGFCGSGPAQLALALLLDVTDDGKLATFLHQRFKAEIVANWGESWEISSDEINAWVENNKDTGL